MIEWVSHITWWERNLGGQNDHVWCEILDFLAFAMHFMVGLLAPLHTWTWLLSFSWGSWFSLTVFAFLTYHITISNKNKNEKTQSWSIRITQQINTNVTQLRDLLNIQASNLEYNKKRHIHENVIIKMQGYASLKPGNLRQWTTTKQ